MPPTTLAANHEEQDGVVGFPHPGIVLLAAALVAFNFLAFILVQRNNSNLEKGDFKMFYSAAVALRTGHAAELYSRDFHAPFQRQLVPSLPLQDVKVYTHPPYELLLFWPLSFLSYKAACNCWLAITLFLAVVCGRMLRAYLAVLALFPLLATLLQQQDSVLALLVLVGCWRAFRRGRDEWAGFLLGLALFKFQLVLPLTLVLLFWKPRILKGFAPSATLVLLLSLAMVGPPGLRSYAGYLSGMAHDSESAVSRFYKVDPRTTPTLRGLAYELVSQGAESVSSATARILPWTVGLLDLACLVFAWKFMREEVPAETKFAFAILIALLVSFHLLMHDLMLLALPFVLLRGLPARWPLIPFYVAPLIYLFYPHSQGWLALLLIASCALIAFDTSMSGSNPVGEVHHSDPEQAPV
jgi:hypothetical protein